MPMRDVAPELKPSARALAAAASLLAACISPPTLTLGATSSWQAREVGVAHAWTAGAQLGWSARTPASSAALTDAAFAPASAAPDRDPESGAPCAFASTCTWEHEARSAALLRARETYEGELP